MKGAATLAIGLLMAVTPAGRTQDAPVVFKSRVNLVLVPVTVHDGRGQAVGDLRREDFRLFDRGKAQEISKFSVETTRRGPKALAGPLATTAATAPPDQTPPALPGRFIAYLFDDIHLAAGDLTRARDAASRQLDALPATDRTAVLSTSGQTFQDFTGDRARLRQALSRLMPRPIVEPKGTKCPDISYYLADMMVTRHDAAAVRVAVSEVLACLPGMRPAQAEAMAWNEARLVAGAGERETRVSFAVLRNAIRRMSLLEGQRAIVLVSPGFHTSRLQTEENEVLDLAAHANVIVNALDAAGVGTNQELSAAQRSSSRARVEFDRNAAFTEADVLAELAAGTGGTFFRNSNDLGEGIRQLSEAPEYYYVLGFSPRNLEADGAFHSLRVALKDRRGLTLSARRGYNAPRAAEPQQAIAQEVRDALLSGMEVSDLAAELKAAVSGRGGGPPGVTVEVRFDPRAAAIRDAGSITITTALFDNRGSLVKGGSRSLQPAAFTAPVVSVKTEYEIGAGTWLVRLAITDVNGQLLSAKTESIAVP